MDTMFPFGFPMATAFYLVCYVVTLILHVAPMNYVLAGTAYIALTGRGGDSAGPRAVLLDWMPLMVSVAITAGVAPLLFVQILYQTQFYTANLLLFHRWMAILPVLIVSAYGLYLLKSGWLARRPGVLNTLAALLPAAGVAFVGYSWTENHLLSLRPVSEWADFYAAGRLVYADPVLLPRLSLWAAGSVATMCWILGLQLVGKERLRDDGRSFARPVATLALAGLALSAAAGAWYGSAAERLADFTGPLALPYFVAATVGLALQVAGWLWVRSRGRFARGPMALAGVGLVLTLVGMTVCRESIRLHALGIDGLAALYPRHERAADVGGLGAFLAFFALNAALIGTCVLIVRRGRA